jgi:glycerophosphoryl diester phosphodiesterase
MSNWMIDSPSRSRNAHEAGLHSATVPDRPPTSGVGAADVPLLVAHRAGNGLDLLRASEAAGVSFAEADIHLFRGRLEVRHLRTLGPVPVFWDRWQVAPPWRPRLLLADLLAAARSTTELMLDLKGRKPRLAELVSEAIDPYVGQRRLTISARCWPLLELFDGLPVRRLHSIRSARQLRALVRRSAGRRLDGVAIHERLLDLDAVADLRRIAGIVMTWPVNDAGRATELLSLGIDGLITDRPEAIAHLVPAEGIA